MLGYEINFPPPAQLETRRKQLNDAGFQAWLSPIILLITIYIGCLMLAKSPIADGRVRSKSPSSLQVLHRRLLWMLNTTYLPEFGPLHVQITGAFYLLWLLFLIFRNTGNDYLHLTKAFGHVAVSQLPLHYLLAFKTPRSPITLATGLTHERLNNYHRLFGRIIHGLLATHAILYLRFFIVKDLLAKRMQDRDVRLGITAFWLVNFLGLLALPIFRKKAYHKLFYRSHVVISASLVVVLFFHVPYTRMYVLQAGVFWLANGLFRTRASERVKVRCEATDAASLLRIMFDIDKASPLADWTPGQHIYLRRGVLRPKNPFTIAGAQESSDGRNLEMMVVARNLSGPQTGTLAQSAAAKAVEELALEGPYGEASQYMPQLVQQLRNAGQIVLFAGGVGASYALPIYQHLLKSQGDTTGLKLVWLVKNLDDSQWGIELLQQISQAFDVDIYITRKPQTNSVKSNAIKGINIFDSSSRPNMTNILDRVMAAPKSDHVSNGSLVSNVKRDPIRTKKTHGKITVLVCGPRSLTQSVRREVGRHVVDYGRDIDWFEEQFGFGGS